jgi:hypothetical protein
MARTRRCVCLLVALAALVAAPRARAETLGVLAVAPPPGPGPELARLTAELRQRLAERRPGTLDVAHTRDRMLPAHGPTVAELERGLEAARVAYLAGQWERSLSQLRSIADDAEKLPDTPEVFAVWTRALTRLARIELDLGRPDAARPWIERLVRAAPDLAFDPALHPARLVEEVERARKALATAPTATLTVTSTVPGARVRVSGRDLGPAPAKAVLVRGAYRVSGAAGREEVGPIPVDLGEGGAEVLLDFTVAQALRPDAGPGLALGTRGRREAIAAAGARLGLDRVVAVGLTADAGGAYVGASLHDVRGGTLERECRVRRAEDGALPPGAMAAIADFLVTGRASGSLVEPMEPPAAPVPPPAAVPVPPEPAARFSLGLRIGYAGAQGNVESGHNMDEWIGAQIPVQLDLLVRVAARLTVGVYGAYGVGRAGSGSDVGQVCDRSGMRCSLMLIRAGVQAEWAFDAPQAGPWIAAGAGYEWNAFHSEDGSWAGAQDILYRGLEWLNLAVGHEWRPSPSFFLGPYLLVSGGAYDQVHRRIAGVSSDVPASRAFHSWVQAGLRGRIGF